MLQYAAYCSTAFSFHLVLAVLSASFIKHGLLQSLCSLLMQVTPGPNMAGMLGPNGEPLTDGSMGKSPNKNRTGGGKRRRNGRWNEHETNTLIELVRQLGKGKWKKILEEGAAAFNNRSQVGPATSARPHAWHPPSSAVLLYVTLFNAE